MRKELLVALEKQKTQIGMLESNNASLTRELKNLKRDKMLLEQTTNVKYEEL